MSNFSLLRNAYRWPETSNPEANQSQSLIQSSPISQLYQIANFGSLTVVKFNKPSANHEKLYSVLRNDGSDVKNWISRARRNTPVIYPRMMRTTRAQIGSKQGRDANER